MPGSVRIKNVNGISTVVDVNTVGGSPARLAAFSDKALTQTVVLPATITTDTTFWLPVTGPVTVSVKVAGTEIGPGEVFLSTSAPVSFAVDSDPRNSDVDQLIRLSGARLGAAVAATTLGSVVAKIQIFDSAGVSAGFLPVYDAIT